MTSTSNDSAPLLKIEDVRKTYTLGKIEVRALHGVTLDITSGSFTALIGRSGSGKSTLLHILGGIDPPSSGKVLLRQTDVYALPDDARSDLRAKNVGFVFQTFNLIPVLNVYDNVEYPLLLRNMPKKERRDRTLAVLERVGLSTMAQRLPSYLSGGQRQRVAIARALVIEPALVLADEPTANVDSVTANDLLQLMRQMVNDFRTTFLCATHDSRVMDFADRQINLVDGKLA